MKILKITNYNDITNISNYLNDDFIVDLENCSISAKRRVMDFLSGLLYQKGKLEKVNKNQFMVKGL